MFILKILLKVFISLVSYILISSLITLIALSPYILLKCFTSISDLYCILINFIFVMILGGGLE